MKKLILIAVLSTWSGMLHAQSEVDLFRYSSLRQSPSARVAGLGGAFGALGGDIGGISLNPAGLATFRKSTINLTPGLVSQNSTGDYLGNTNSDSRSRLTMNSVGFVFAKRPAAKGSKWLQVNYGFTLNRANNYVNAQRYEGVNTNSSMVDFFVNEANQGNEFFPEDYPFSAGLAQQVGLISSVVPGNNASAFNGIVPAGAAVRQSEQIRSLGSTSDYNFSVAGNYDNKLHVGGGISLMSSSFNSTEIYSEFDHMDTIFDFKDFAYRRTLGVEMDGFVLRLGAVFQPIAWFRVGLSYESPTRYTVSEDFRVDLEANYDSVPTFASASSPLFRPFVYNYRTTGRTTASAAFLFAGKGLISVDYDYVPYDELRVTALRNDQGSEPWARNLNDRVAVLFRTSNNIRVGGEYVIGPLAVRAGYAFWGSPYRADVNTGGGDLSQRDFSLGLGTRFDNFSLDLSFVRAYWKSYRSPYVVESLPEDGVLFSNTRTLVQFSMGFRLD
jgi:long-subunit fatty acid transport protein